MRYTEFTPFDLWLLAQGLGVTIGLFLVTSLIGLVIGVLWGVVRFYRVPVLMQVITFVAEILKNSPVLVQLFLVFFGFPAFFHVNVTPVQAAIVTLGSDEIARIIDEEENDLTEVVCHFCNEKYHFTPDQMQQILQEAL